MKKILVRFHEDYPRLDFTEVAHWSISEPEDGSPVGTKDGTWLTFKTKQEALTCVKNLGGVPVYDS